MRSMAHAGVTKVSRLPENKSSASPRLILKNAAAWRKSLQWVKPWSRNHASRVACAHAQLFQLLISNSLAGTEETTRFSCWNPSKFTVTSQSPRCTRPGHHFSGLTIVKACACLRVSVNPHARLISSRQVALGLAAGKCFEEIVHDRQMKRKFMTLL